MSTAVCVRADTRDMRQASQQTRGAESQRGNTTQITW